MDGRRLIVSQVGTLTAGGSLDLGTFPVAQYPRLSGFIRVDSVTNNTANIQFRGAVSSGSTLITSQSAVASGGSEFNIPQNFSVMGLGITPVQSATAFSVIVFGEPAR